MNAPAAYKWNDVLTGKRSEKFFRFLKKVGGNYEI